VDLNFPGEPRVEREKPPYQRFDAGVDVRAIERRDSGLNERGHVVHGLLRIDDAVISREVPSPFDDARNFISIGYSDSHGRGDDYSSIVGTGVAVVELRSKRRLPRRVILNVEGQFGSGQATSESEYIQS
jgi:hypothetical protein